MTIYHWIVVVLVIGWGLYELYDSYKTRKANKWSFGENSPKKYDTLKELLEEDAVKLAEKTVKKQAKKATKRVAKKAK